MNKKGMALEETIKYLVWIAFFILILGGLYFLFRSLGVIG